MQADMGGTELYACLSDVLSAPVTPGYPRQVFLLTDGQRRPMMAHACHHVSRHIMSCQTISCHVMACWMSLCHVMSCNAMPGHVVYCLLISCVGCRLTSTRSCPGQVSDASSLISLVTSHSSSHRLFSLGIGSSVDRSLCSSLAHAGHGSCEFVSSNTDIARAVMIQLQRAVEPSVCVISVDWRVFARACGYDEKQVEGQLVQVSET